MAGVFFSCKIYSVFKFSITIHIKKNQIFSKPQEIKNSKLDIRGLSHKNSEWNFTLDEMNVFLLLYFSLSALCVVCMPNALEFYKDFNDNDLKFAPAFLIFRFNIFDNWLLLRIASFAAAITSFFGACYCLCEIINYLRVDSRFKGHYIFKNIGFFSFFSINTGFWIRPYSFLMDFINKQPKYQYYDIIDWKQLFYIATFACIYVFIHIFYKQLLNLKFYYDGFFYWGFRTTAYWPYDAKIGYRDKLTKNSLTVGISINLFLFWNMLRFTFHGLGVKGSSSVNWINAQFNFVLAKIICVYFIIFLISLLILFLKLSSVVKKIMGDWGFINVFWISVIIFLLILSVYFYLYLDWCLIQHDKIARYLAYREASQGLWDDYIFKNKINIHTNYNSK